MRRHLALQATEPRVVEHAITEQTLALSHGAFVRSSGGAMLRSARKRQAIEETAAITGSTRPQAIHRRRQPRHARGLCEI